MPVDVLQASAALDAAPSREVPAYLTRVYWWAYVHPKAVKLFERQWLVSLILWGNYRRLRDAAIDLLGAMLPGRTLQIACVYGDLTRRLSRRVPEHDADASIEVVDILPVQLDNLQRKLGPGHSVGLVHGNSANLPFDSACYDRALLFFLLHEMPEDVRRATLAEALRVVKPGGRLVILDYARPHPAHPLYWPMVAILRAFEPFALDLWRAPLTDWFPPGSTARVASRRTLFGGLYQLLDVHV